MEVKYASNGKFVWVLLLLILIVIKANPLQILLILCKLMLYLMHLLLADICDEIKT